MVERTPLLVNHPGFDFEALLNAAVRHEELDLDATFSQSPLTTEDEREDHIQISPMGRGLDESTPPFPCPVFNASSMIPPTSSSVGQITPATDKTQGSNDEKKDDFDSQKARKRKQSHANRKKKRQLLRENLETMNKVKKVNAHKHFSNCKPVQTLFESEKSNVVSTGFTGCDDNTRPSTLYTLGDVVGENSKFKFKLQQWNGK